MRVMKRSLLAALCVLLPAPAFAQARLVDEEAVIVDIDLGQLRSMAGAFEKVHVRFEAQFCSLGQVWNPFFTRFVPSEYANFYAWSGDQPIWRKDSYEDVFGMLFISKSSPELPLLYKLRTYDRVRIEGVVQDTFQGQPWIEVVKLEPITGRVDSPTLSHLYRADTYMQRREWNKAVSELSLAPGGDQPAHVLAAINKNLGVCYLRLGEVGRAQTYLATAERLTNGVDLELSRLTLAAADDPSSQIDRQVDRSKVNESRRPLWEAFEDLDSTGSTRAGAPAKPQR